MMFLLGYDMYMHVLHSCFISGVTKLEDTWEKT